MLDSALNGKDNIMYTIELDCAPGGPRPGDLIKGVVEGTPIEPKLGETISRFFGNWTWAFDVSEEEWKEAQPALKERIIGLYNSGVIRYGSW